jgi:ribosomal protein L7/L12
MTLGLVAALSRLGARANWYRRLQLLLQTFPGPTYEVVLIDPGASPIAVIREMRDATGLPLREIEHLLRSCPQTIAASLPRAGAETLRQRLESAGCRIEVKLVTR